MEEYGEWISVGKGKAAITKQVIDWAGVKSHLMSQCREAGFFENRRIRGSGVWLDQGKPVVHLGDRLWYEGADHDLRALPSEFIYEYGRKLAPVHERPLTLPEMGLFRDVVASLNYAAPSSSCS
jgi:putative DNA primase/helicase